MISAQKVVMDNEKAVVSALRTHYDGVDINLCLFTTLRVFLSVLRQTVCIQRGKNNNLQKMVKSIITLTFLPQDLLWGH